MAPLAALAAERPIAVPHVAEFGRWFVACDNIRTCEARGVGEGTAADLRVIRAAGATVAEVTLTVAGRGGAPITIGGTPATLQGWAHAGGDEDTYKTSNPALIGPFLAMARAAQSIAVGRDGTIPLDGMTAALLRMDDVQGRVGTPTALAARAGRRPIPPEPALPPRPDWTQEAPLHRHQAASLARRTRAGHSRALKSEGCTQAADDTAYALDREWAVVLLACLQGAYQGSSLVFIVPRAGGAGTAFVSVIPGIPGRSALLTEAGFDPATGTLSTAARGRGIADCGLSASWVWSGGAFRLLEAAYQPICGGAAPGDWPAIYRTR